MRIYNRKNFAFGVFCTLLGAFNLALDLVTGEWSLYGALLVLLLLFFGVGAIGRSLSPRLSREDKLEERDERNRLVQLRARGLSFQMTQGIVFLLMAGALVAGKLPGAQSFIGIGVGMAFALSIAMFTELFAYFHYEKRL